MTGHDELQEQPGLDLAAWHLPLFEQKEQQEGEDHAGEPEQAGEGEQRLHLPAHRGGLHPGVVVGNAEDGRSLSSASRMIISG